MAPHSWSGAIQVSRSSETPNWSSKEKSIRWEIVSPKVSFHCTLLQMMYKLLFDNNKDQS